MPEADTAPRASARPAAPAGAGLRAWLRPAGLRRALIAAGPPAGALLAANLLWLTAAEASSHNFFRPRLWVRHDSLHYLEIAQHGYIYMTCAGHSAYYGKGDWCGDAGGVPGYPYLIWVLQRLGLSAPAAGVILSSVFGFAMLALLWNGFLAQRRDISSVLALGLAAFFFGQVYQHAVFPISMEIFLLLAVIWLAVRRRWAAAGLAGMAAAFTYTAGFLVAPAVVVWVLLDRRAGPIRSRVAAAAVTGGLTALGLAAVLVVQYVATGVWGAFFKVQAKYHYHGLHLPTSKFLWTVGSLLHHSPGIQSAPAAQTLLVAVFCLSLVAAALASRGRLEAADWLVMSVTLWFWLFPLSLGAGLDLYRSEALLVPSVVLARRLPTAVQVLFLLAMVPLAFAMSVLFFRKVLI